jgi:flagellin-like hook-associated protein FlgL
MITGDYSTLGVLIADNTSVKAQLNKLTAQIASGHVADSYGGLGAASQTSLDLRPQLNTLTNEQNVIGSVTGQLDITQNALSQINSIASSFAAQTDSLNGLDPAAVDSVAAAAKSALQQLAALLDTNDGGNYVFAGTDSNNPPVPNPDQILSSGLYTQINAAVSGLSSTTDNSAGIIASTLSVAQSNAAGTTPFSSTIGTAQTLQLSNGQLVQTGLVANANTLATSTGTSTTGSYVRDLLRGLSTLASLTSGQVNDPGFGAVVADTRTSLQGAVTALATETGALGTIQAGLTTTATADGETTTALQQQLSSVEDVDTATALTQLSAVQTQLQASYQLIAGARSLSLVQYL